MSGYKNCPACHGVGYLPIEPGSAMTYPCDCTTQVDEVAQMEEQARMLTALLMTTTTNRSSRHGPRH